MTLAVKGHIRWVFDPRDVEQRRCNVRKVRELVGDAPPGDTRAFYDVRNVDASLDTPIFGGDRRAVVRAELFLLDGGQICENPRGTARVNQAFKIRARHLFGSVTAFHYDRC